MQILRLTSQRSSNRSHGLNSNVNGLLSVRQGKQGLGLYGVHLREGRFAAYGQDLLIRKGDISFAGSPSQPTLDIEAIRNWRQWKIRPLQLG